MHLLTLKEVQQKRIYTDHIHKKTFYIWIHTVFLLQSVHNTSTKYTCKFKAWWVTP